MNDDHESILITTFFEELDDVCDVRILGFSPCENLKRGNGFGADTYATSVMFAF